VAFDPGALDAFDVVIVPFPFTDSGAAKRRPALVVSTAASLGDRIGHSVMAMITSVGNAPWPLDVRIADLAAAGLPGPSVVRMKLFTLDHRLIVRRAGALAARDRAAVTAAVRELMPWVAT
jgi:mRNA interferase MazF